MTGREIEFTFLMERDGCTRHVNSHLDELITDYSIFLGLNFSFAFQMKLENLLLDFKFQSDMQNTWQFVSAISKEVGTIYSYD